jgi:hypothetical protein
MPEEQDTPEKAADRQAQMISLAQQLINEIDNLGEKAGYQFVSLAKRARTNRLLIIATAVSVAIDLIITVVLALVGVSMQHNTDRIDSLTQRLNEAQTVQRQKALCPLYQVFLDSESAAGRKAAPDPEKYDHAFVVIHKGYDALECDQYITGTPTPVSPGP